jgi:hypothetical protein
VLLAVRALGDGRWITHAVDAAGDLAVEALDAGGQALWRLDLGPATAPVVAAAPRGRWTAVGVLEEDLATARLSIVDGRGAVRAEVRLPVLRSLCFDETGEFLAVGGGHSVTLLRTLTGERLWTQDLDQPLALGNPLSFASDGSSLRALAQPRGDEPGEDTPITLVEWTIGETPPRAVPRELVEVGPRPAAAVLELTETSGAWRLVTRDGSWTWND